MAVFEIDGLFGETPTTTTTKLGIYSREDITNNN